jgi:hypothetical protein
MLPQSLAVHIPALQQEVNNIIAQKSTNQNNIEHHLDTLLPITAHGIGDKLYVQLLEYYKTINHMAADYYCGEYDKEEE